MSRVESRYAVVTGAAGGVGQAICRELVSEGYVVAGLDKDRPAYDQQTGHIDLHSFVAVDLASPEATRIAFDNAVAEFPRLDLLVNCAGIREVKSVLDLELEEWLSVMAVNLTSVFVLSQAAGKTMSRTGSGSIVNISSVSGMIGVPSRSAYCSSKHGVIGLTRAMAADLGPFGIHVNAVCPGMVETPMTASYATEPEMVDGIDATVPLKRLGMAGEVANVVVFLAGEGSSFINGAVVPVDGGFTAVKTYNPLGKSKSFG